MRRSAPLRMLGIRRRRRILGVPIGTSRTDWRRVGAAGMGAIAALGTASSLLVRRRPPGERPSEDSGLRPDHGRETAEGDDEEGAGEPSGGRPQPEPSNREDRPRGRPPAGRVRRNGWQRGRRRKADGIPNGRSGGPPGRKRKQADRSGSTYPRQHRAGTDPADGAHGITEERS